MEKRLLLAVALSILVLLGWSLLASKVYHIENKEVTTQDIPLVSSVPEKTPLPPPIIEEKPVEQELFQYHTANIKIAFIEPLAAMQSVTFKDYRDYAFLLQRGLLIDDKSLTFTKTASDSSSVTFTHADSVKRIEKKFIFSNSNYSIVLELTIENLSSAGLSLRLPLVLGAMDLSANNSQVRYEDVTVVTKEKTLHFNPQKNIEVAGVKFASFRDRYFCAIVEPQFNDNSAQILKTGTQVSEVRLISKDILLPVGQQVMQKFHIYLGPQDLKLIDKIDSEWSAVVYYGTFDFISQILLQLLEFLFKLVHNWGWAIIIFSIIVYLVLYPLTLKQLRSMKEMQVLQPQIEELRKAYKDNQQRFNKEVMELYRKHKVNPLGGCLPIILQMPIFIALWQAFQRSILLKDSTFLWIKDLSSPDRLLILPGTWPIKEFNILPLITALLMVLQQKMYTPAATSSSAQQQKLMSILMPLVFGFAFYSMPSGWVLYFLVNSILMLINQARLSKMQ